ncbi:MAG: hypothetical protein ABIG93_01810 [archaeon]|nr:hypothetical protein [Nanoarchaeota archaeon]
MISVRDKKGQLTLTFNWIYVLIAGAVILLFFIGIIVKQKSISEEKLSYDISRTLESILTAAAVSEKTLNKIDTSGLKDYTIFFNCEVDGGGFKDVFSGYGIVGSSATVETPIEPIFAPEEIKTTEIIAWSLPYEYPFKVMDLLMITSSNTKYYVLGEDSAGFRKELENATSGSLNIEFFSNPTDDYDTLKAGNNFHIRIIDLDGSSNEITHMGAVPEDMEELDDAQVSAVSFTSSRNAVYYNKVGNHFEDAGKVEIISLQPNERDAAKYAVIFAGSKDDYECNMIKVLKRLEILGEIYLLKYQELLEYYDPSSPTHNSNCWTLISSETSALDSFYFVAGSCAVGYENCEKGQLESLALNIKSLNDDLSEGCIGIY